MSHNPMVCTVCYFYRTIQIFCFVGYWRRNGIGLRWDSTAAARFIDFIKACGSGGRKKLYTILVEFGISVKLVTVIKVYLNEACG